MSAKICSICGKDKGIRITCYNNLDGTGLHIICCDCQKSAIRLYNNILEKVKKISK